MTSVLDRWRPDPGPVHGRWAAGVGETLTAVLRPPDVLAAPLRLLNYFGGVAISAEAVEFDGDDVEWSDVDDIETVSLFGYLFSGALDKQLNKLPLPRFPGRSLMVGVASDAALTAIVAATGDTLRSVDVKIPAEINYRGLVRRRTLSPGILATLLLADGAVRSSLTATAEAKGIRVRPSDDDPLEEAALRATRIKRFVGRLANR
ncbi:hypothetical protein [Mycobacterium sp. NPDC050041]|uniref:hypothetical protein n=1 Tax=Mycobacterium sp. NPDC050041 TaxID=3364293 RepID=UPI003C2AFBF1